MSDGRTVNIKKALIGMLIITIELIALILVNVTAYYDMLNITHDSMYDFYFEDGERKYDTYPSYSGTVEEIKANYGLILIRNEETGQFDVASQDEYEDADSIKLANDNANHAWISISGEDGIHQFFVDNCTFLYYGIDNYGMGTTIQKGQMIEVAYGSDYYVDGDYAYAIKGSHPSDESKIILPYIVSALVPSIIVFLFSIILIVSLAKEKDERNTFNKVMIDFSSVVIVIALLFGIVEYSEVRKAVEAPKWVMSHAPIIYLYPETDEQVNVRLTLNGKLTETYPEYKPSEGWTVTASPDGTLTDSDGNTYPFLFWEAELIMDYDLSRGYCVKGSDTEAFLDSALEELGLSENESSDFKSYWLPLMEGNPYNVITFQTTAYDNAVSHSVKPEPDTVIRVNMLWYASSKYVEMEPQDLTGINPALDEREGFVFVEWGGEETDEF